MKRLVMAVALLALLALNWAALHDIARGEPNLVLEWLVVAVSGLGAGLWIARRLVGRPA